MRLYVALVLLLQCAAAFAQSQSTNPASSELPSADALNSQAEERIKNIDARLETAQKRAAEIEAAFADKRVSDIGVAGLKAEKAVATNVGNAVSTSPFSKLKAGMGADEAIDEISNIMKMADNLIDYATTTKNELSAIRNEIRELNKDRETLSSFQTAFGEYQKAAAAEEEKRQEAAAEAERQAKAAQQAKAAENARKAKEAAAKSRARERSSEGPRENSGIRDRDTGVRDTGPRDTGSRDTGPKDTGPRDTGPKDTGPRGPEIRIP